MKLNGIDVTERFFTSYHDPDEVVAYLNSCSGSTGGQFDSGMKFRVKIPIDKLSLELTLIYKKDHSIDRLIQTKGTPEDLTLFIGYMNHEFMTGGKADVVSLVMYSHGIPVKGYYRNNELGIQIAPLPDGYPKGRYANDLHPFVVQIRYIKVRQVWLNATRRDKRCRLVKLTLTACLNTTISYPTDQVRWGTEPQSNGQHNPISFVDGYWLKELEADSDGFLPIGNTREMRLIDPSIYIPQNAFTYEHELELPSNIGDVLALVSRLPRKALRSYLRSGYWVAQSATASSSTLRYLCLSLALESILPEREKVNFCGTCQRDTDQPISESVGNSIKKFLVRFAGVPESHVSKYKGKLYGLRSAIAHGDHLFEMDEHFQIGLSSQQIDEGESYRSLKAVTRIAMYNWLITQAHVSGG